MRIEGTIIRWWLPLYVLVWFSARLISDANLDPAGDMLENYAWGQVFSWGESKHPPLIGWVTALWFSIFPTSNAAYFLLAYASAAFGLVGVYRFAVAYGLGSKALPAVLLLTLALPYSTLAVKYNANTILLSLWPWVAWAWIRAIKKPGWGSAVPLGALAALSLLGKYFSGTLLLSLFVATLATAPGRSWITSRYMWASVIVGITLLTPHIFWLFQHDFVTLNYIQSKNQERGEPLGNAVRFTFIPLVYWLFPLVLSAWMMTSQSGSKWWQRLKNLALAWRFNTRHPDLFIVALGPYLLSLVFGFSGFVVLASPWAIPMGFAFTLLWLSNLNHEGIDWPAIRRGSGRAFAIWLTLILVISPIYLWQQGKSGSDNFYKPRATAATEILKQWQARFPDQKPAWVGGSQWPELSLISFYGDEQIVAFAGFPKLSGNTLPPPEDWQEQPGMILCILGYVEKPLRQNCPQLAEAWLAKQGQDTDFFDIIIARQGLRFPLEKPYQYRVYAYIPAPEK